MEDKLEWAFQLYDIDGDGKISYDEMLAIVEAIYKMVRAQIQNPRYSLILLGRVNGQAAEGRRHPRKARAQDIQDDGQG